MKKIRFGKWFLLILITALFECDEVRATCYTNAEGCVECGPKTNDWSGSCPYVVTNGAVSPTSIYVCYGSAPTMPTNKNPNAYSPTNIFTRTITYDCTNSVTTNTVNVTYSSSLVWTNFSSPYTNFPATVTNSFTADAYTLAVSSDTNKCPGEFVKIATVTWYPVKLLSLSVSGATAIDSTNYAAVKTTNANDFVTITASLNVSDTNAASLLTWSGGQAVSNNILARQVPKNASAKTVVTASCCSTSMTANIWIVWADLTIKTGAGDTIDSGDDASNLAAGHSWPTSLGGSNLLGAIDAYSNPNLTYAKAVGKIEAKATLQPAGIENLITNGWHMHRHAQFIAFDNGAVTVSDTRDFVYDDTSDAGWMDENPKSGSSAREIYDLDAPGCPITAGAVNHTSEVYDNFKEYASVTLGGSEQRCSDEKPWSYKANIDNDKAANKVEVNSVAASNITLPASAHYPVR